MRYRHIRRGRSRPAPTTTKSTAKSTADVDTDHAGGAGLSLARNGVDQQADVVTGFDLGDCGLEIRHRVDVVARLWVEDGHDDVVGEQFVVVRTSGCDAGAPNATIGVGDARLMRHLVAHGLDLHSELLGADAAVGLLAVHFVRGHLLIAWCFGELDLERLAGAEAHDVELDRLARLVQPHDPLERAHAVGGLAIGGNDDVADFETGLLTGARSVAGGEPTDFDTGDRLEARGRGVIRIDVGNRDAQHGATNLAVLDEVIHHALGERDRNGEAIARVVASGAGDRAVDADDFTADVDQRAAGVAGVDRRIRLNEVRDRVLIAEQASELTAA